MVIRYCTLVTEVGMDINGNVESPPNKINLHGMWENY